MTTPQSNHDLVEILDPDVDPDQIMVDIRNKMRKERQARKYDERAFPKFGESLILDELDALDIEPELYRQLQQLNEDCALIDNSILLADSPATRLPVIGNLWQKVRGGAHQLVLFYIHRHANQQQKVNQDLVNTLTRLTILVREQQDVIEELRAETTNGRSNHQ